MKNTSRKMLAMLLSIVMALSICFVPAYAAENNDQTLSVVDSSNQYLDSSEWIIGGADEKPESRIPNLLNIDWDATATQVIIYVQNVGVDTVDTFAGRVIVENGTPVYFSTYSIAPLTTRTITVTVNMQQCYEDIVVYYYGIDGGTEFGAGSSPGHREIPSSLSSLWVQGNSPTLYDSINYHYGKHAAEVGSTNIVDYATKAANYRASVVADINSLSSTELDNKYKISDSTGATIAHKYKHRTNLQFAILSDVGYYIVSYGL